MPDNTYGIGDTVWTYTRRFSRDPHPVQGVVLYYLHMPGHYPPDKYIVAHNGVLCVRDELTLGRKIEDVAVFGSRESEHAPSTLKDFTYDD